MFDTIILLTGPVERTVCRRRWSGIIRDLDRAADRARRRACCAERRCAAARAACRVRYSGDRAEEHSRSARLWCFQFSSGAAELSRMGAGAFCALRSGEPNSARPCIHGRAGGCRSDHRVRARFQFRRRSPCWASKGSPMRILRFCSGAWRKVGIGFRASADAAGQMGEQEKFAPELSRDVRDSAGNFEKRIRPAHAGFRRQSFRRRRRRSVCTAWNSAPSTAAVKSAG